MSCVLYFKTNYIKLANHYYTLYIELTTSNNYYKYTYVPIKSNREKIQPVPGGYVRTNFVRTLRKTY